MMTNETTTQHKNTKVYRIQKLIDGYKLGKKIGDECDFLVAVPEGYTHVNYKEDVRKLGVPVCTRTFRDKFKRDTSYTLSYYPWTKEKDLFGEVG